MADDSTKVKPDPKSIVDNEGIVDTDLACGMAPIETDTWDPSQEVCDQHDLEDDARIEGLPNDGLLDTTTDFIEGEAKVEAKGWYAVVSAPLYAIAATVVNPFLWIYEGITGKSPDAKQLPSKVEIKPLEQQAQPVSPEPPKT